MLAGLEHRADQVVEAHASSRPGEFKVSHDVSLFSKLLLSGSSDGSTNLLLPLQISQRYFR